MKLFFSIRDDIKFKRFVHKDNVQTVLKLFKNKLINAVTPSQDQAQSHYSNQLLFEEADENMGSLLGFQHDYQLFWFF